jgi:hypothetical protein
VVVMLLLLLMMMMMIMMMMIMITMMTFAQATHSVHKQQVALRCQYLRD